MRCLAPVVGDVFIWLAVCVFVCLLARLVARLFVWPIVCLMCGIVGGVCEFADLPDRMIACLCVC